MKKELNILIAAMTLLALSSPGEPLSAAGPGTAPPPRRPAPNFKPTNQLAIPSFEIQKYRFSEHLYLNFERLVIEMARQNRTVDEPQLKLIPGTGGKEAMLYLQDSRLIGGIPEAAINDGYVPKSRYLGPLSINTDGSSTGVSIRIFLKNAVRVDAFWLNNPSRLVIDAFPRSARRARGRDIKKLAKLYTTRGLASVKKQKIKRDPIMENVICFPANSQIVPKISFQAKDGNYNIEPTVEWQWAKPDALKKSVCYPRDAQVVAAIGFEQARGFSPKAQRGNVIPRSTPLGPPKGFRPPQQRRGPPPPNFQQGIRPAPRGARRAGPRQPASLAGGATNLSERRRSFRRSPLQGGQLNRGGNTTNRLGSKLQPRVTR